MRYINYNIDFLEVSNDWKEKAETLTNSLLRENDPVERSKIIDENNDVWRDVKPILKEFSFRKCWYTESIQEGTDVDVDHFRPKKRVAEISRNASDNYGYWWLVFNLSNYRYSCIVSNRRRKDVDSGETGGKADYFPLCDESNRATTPACTLEDEQPLLLDPCRLSDTRLLMFNEGGEAMSRYSKEEDSRSHERAEISIKLYNLNHSDFVAARIKLRLELEKLRTKAERFYKKFGTGDADHAESYEQAITDLISKWSPEAPYSSFCKIYMENYKHEEYLQGVL